jgi:hypothetical protein
LLWVFLQVQTAFDGDTQVTKLCRTHRLHSALAFLFNRALSDYAAPAAELLLAHVHAPPKPAGADSAPVQSAPSSCWGPRRATGYKLLVYLHCCFTGRAFPPGGCIFPFSH